MTENKTLLNAIKAANIHKKIGNEVRDIIKPNISLKEIVILVENKIKEYTEFDITNPLNKGIAFPVGVSINNCVAHYTPNYNEKDIILKDNDILKIDYGIHFSGTIIDSAFTISFNEKYTDFINISRNLTNYAVSLCGPDVILGEIGKDIEEYLSSKEFELDGFVYPLNIMRDLSGHKISKYQIHAGKAVPNIYIDYPLRMEENEYYAIEPFITTGKGSSIYKSPNSHYMLCNNPNKLPNLNNYEKELYNIIFKNYYTLPFCNRWLYELNPNMQHDKILEKLVNKNILKEYPPIYDIENSIVSHFEHTIYVKNNGIINLTKNNYY